MKLFEIWGVTAEPVTDLIEYEKYLDMAVRDGINAVIDHARNNYPEYAKAIVREVRQALRYMDDSSIVV